MALPNDVLEFISKKLEFDHDYARFRSICKSWHLAAPKRPKTPWLIAKKVHEDTDFFNFYQFSFECNNFKRISQLLDSSSSLSSYVDKNLVCIGSSYGWMAFFNHRTSTVSLSNPLTNSTIDLPDLQNWTDLVFFVDILDYTICFNLTSDPVDSLSDCFALIYCTERVLYCKIGCSGWSELPHKIGSDHKDHAYCYHGKLFIASHNDVFVCDLSSNPSIRKIVSVSTNDTGTDEFDLKESILVESNGDLLLVCVYYSNEYEDYEEDFYFRIFKLEFDCMLVKLVELTSLGDRSLLLSRKTSLSLTPSKHPGCKGNSIYFTWISSNPEEAFNPKLVIYDFEEDNYVFIADDVSCDVQKIDCTWFTPSLLM